MCGLAAMLTHVYNDFQNVCGGMPQISMLLSVCVPLMIEVFGSIIANTLYTMFSVLHLFWHCIV